MKAGDTFRIGGIPIVVVEDVDVHPARACLSCVFRNQCNTAMNSAGARSVKAVEGWREVDCIRDQVHYEVRV